MAKYPFTTFIRQQFSDLPLAKADLAGKRIVIIGANVGLGLETARHLATMKPAKIILGCRSIEKGQAAIKDITATTGFKSLEVWQIDLESFDSVSKFADRYQSTDGAPPLDILIENAGVMALSFNKTGDEYERTLQVNHLSTALLALLLLPYLSKAKDPRITVVASSTHFQVPKLVAAENESIIDGLNDPAITNIQERYNESKLLNVFFTRGFAKHLLKTSPITIDCVNPGLCRSSLARELSGALKVVAGVMLATLARSTEKGARTIVHAAIAGTHKEMQGRYLNKCQVEEESDYVIGPDGATVQERLWVETIAVLKKVDHRLDDICATFFSN